MIDKIKKIAKKCWLCRFLWSIYKRTFVYRLIYRFFKKKKIIRFQPAVVQLVAGFSKHDAIGNMASELSNELNKRGCANFIVYGNSNECGFNLQNIANFNFNKNDILIYHMSIGSPCSYYFKKANVRRKILIYHNITPAKFFQNNKLTAANCKKGRDELRVLRKTTDVSIAVSKYNKSELDDLKYENTLTIPCIHQIDKLLSLRQTCTKTNKKIFITVGRIAAHKCIEDVIYTFNEYFKLDENSFLYIIGKPDNDVYMSKIKGIIRELNLSKIIKIVGAVSDKELARYYSLANAYICMSEHEGFCIPLIEAMAFGVPVFAYNSSAIGETLDNSGVLFSKKDYKQNARVIFDTFKNPRLIRKIIDKENSRYKDFDNKKNIDRYLDSFGLIEECYLSPSVILLYKIAFDEYYNKVFKGYTLPYSFVEYCNNYLLEK